MRIGISSYTFGWNIGVENYSNEREMTVFDLLAKAIQFRVPVLQIADNIPLNNLNDSNLDDIYREANRNGIDIQTGMRGTDPRKLLEYLDISKKLGSRLLRTLITSEQGIPSNADVVEDIRTVLPLFEKEGISIAIENHEGKKTDDLIHIVQALNNPFVGICVDTINSLGDLECPGEVINKLSPYAINLHLKDFMISRLPHKQGFIVEGRPLGEGQLDIPRTIELIGKNLTNVDAIIELWVPYFDNVEKTVSIEMEWAEKSVTYAKKYMESGLF